MELTPMQYKSYVWPHNPRTYTIQYVRKVAVHKVPFGRYAMQDLGLGRRVMKGEGEFIGQDFTGQAPMRSLRSWPLCSITADRGP